jgi:hypothetical protein
MRNSEVNSSVGVFVCAYECVCVCVNAGEWENDCPCKLFSESVFLGCGVTVNHHSNELPYGQAMHIEDRSAKSERKY